MISIEWVKGTQDRPTSAKMLVGVFEEAANISASLLTSVKISSRRVIGAAYHGHLEERDELEEMANRYEILGPV